MREAAEILGISPKAIKTKIVRGELNAERTGTGEFAGWLVSLPDEIMNTRPQEEVKETKEEVVEQVSYPLKEEIKEKEVIVEMKEEKVMDEKKQEIIPEIPITTVVEENKTEFVDLPSSKQNSQERRKHVGERKPRNNKWWF